MWIKKTNILSLYCVSIINDWYQSWFIENLSTVKLYDKMYRFYEEKMPTV